jgi:hypothetical protein
VPVLKPRRTLRISGASSLGIALCLAGNAAAQDPSGSTPPPATDGAPEAGSAPASDAEADALAAALAESGGTQADAAVEQVQEFALNIYGFTDFTYTQRLNDFAYASPYPTFMVGNVNLYVGAELGSGWRSLVEFRLMYLPHGTVPADQAFVAEPERIDTTVNDPADYGRPLRWGGVEIERAWLEYNVHPLLTIRGGQWLTPYGIWNVDHGTPVIIGVRRPYVVGEALIPERQTGLQAYGSFLTGRTEIGYDLGLSNGRGPLDAYQDMDENKAFTGRLWINSELPLGTLSAGATVYRGTFTDRFSRFAVTATGQAATEYISTARYDELGIAGDLRWVWDGLTVQGELITRETAYDDALRPEAFVLPGVPSGFAADFRSIGWYVMGAYRLPWWNIMPFIGGERYKPGVELTQDAAAIWGGVNIRPVPRVVLKAQYTQSWFTDDTDLVGDDGLQAIDLQAAWSF